MRLLIPLLLAASAGAFWALALIAFARAPLPAAAVVGFVVSAAATVYLDEMLK